MATTVTIQISRAQGASTATFGANPPMNAGDDAFWCNGDSEAHWPAPQGQPRNTWLRFQIPAKLPGEDAPTSDAVSFDYTGSYPYVCALHPGETGVVTVS
jgi:plastocyanin